MISYSILSALSLASVAYGQAGAAVSKKATFSRSPECKASRLDVCTAIPMEGFTAGISRNILGPDTRGCNTCWELTAPGSNPVTVLIDRGCFDDNPLCSSLLDAVSTDSTAASTGASQAKAPTNSAGGEVHFELCDESGASAAFFPTSMMGEEVAAGDPLLGEAKMVDCGTAWKGKRYDGELVGDITSTV